MLRRSLTPDRPLALLQRHVRAPFAQLPLALVGDVEAVHQLRVAGRRLRVALPILAANPESRAVRRALRVLRQLIRAAGPTRDRDVSFLILQECPPSLAKPGGAFPILRRRLRQGLQRSRAGLVTAMLDLDISGLRRDLRGALAAGSADLPTAQRRSDEAARPLGQALFQGFGTLGGRYDAQSLHRLRRQARRLRYLAEVQGELCDRVSPAVALLKSLQEPLGIMRDHELLVMQLEALAARAAQRGEASLVGQAHRLKRYFGRTVRAHHRSLLAERPLAVLARVLRVLGRPAP